MKKIILLAAVFALISFNVVDVFAPEHAVVERQNSLLLFIRSKPAKPYKNLGHIDMPDLVWKGKADEMINKATKRCKEQYPEANGVIFTHPDLWSADAVLIEE